MKTPTPARRTWDGPPKWRCLLVVALLTSAALAPLAPAQGVSTGNTAVQQVQIFNQRTSTQRSDEERLEAPSDPLTGEEAAADSDLGEQWLFKPNPPLTPWNAYANISAFYTTNAALASVAAQSDRFLVADAGISYARPIAPNWAFAAHLQQAFFRYDEFRALDFDSLGANMGVSYHARQLADVLFSAQYSFSRLTRATFDDELFLGNTVALTATKLIRVTSADTLELGGAIGYTLADPEELERAEFRLSVGYSLRITRALTASAVARAELFEYSNGREDLLQSVAIAARYDFNKWISAGLSASMAANMSDRDVFDYGVFNGGLTASAHVQF